MKRYLLAFFAIIALSNNALADQTLPNIATRLEKKVRIDLESCGLKLLDPQEAGLPASLWDATYAVVSPMAAGAHSLKKMSFELGGKGASIIFADADIERAAKVATRAAMRNQGQVCLAGSRLLVEESVASRVIDIVKSEIAKIKMGRQC